MAVVVLILHFFAFHFTFAQRESYPKGYFIFPINPGQKNTLAGVLGDLRSNHFHAGIDIRTQQREGLEVLASAEGYVSKIKVQTNGYGNVIFIKHPNGMTTVYGHLLSFADPMGSFLRQKQYERQSFEIEINPAPTQFPVQKGQLIGLSGNTGGSGGPHLHFEIRDSQDNYLNPLFFGFSEVKDDVSPYFSTLAIRPMGLDSRLNGEFERVSFRPIRQKDGTYLLPQTVKAWGELGLELIAFDAMNDVAFKNGINCVEIKMDGQEVFAYNMTSFPSWSTRDYNHLIDYATEQRTGARFLKCYNPDGNRFNLSKTDRYGGKLQVRDTLEHAVEITLFDSFENATTLRFNIKGTRPVAPMSPLLETDAVPNFAYMKTEVAENILKITALGLARWTQAEVFMPKNNARLAPAYQTNDEMVYLLDLRSYLPDSVRIGNKLIRTYFQKKIIPNNLDTYTGRSYAIRFGNQSIFDTLYLAVQTSPTGLIINDEYTPLRDAIGVNFQPDALPQNPEKTHVYRTDGGKMRFVGGRWRDNSMEFTTREMGSFSLATDTILPNVQWLATNKKSIAARISDGLSGIDKFRAYVNDEWVLMNYDYKRSYIWSEKLVDSTDFEGVVRLEVTDRAGNLTTLETNIKEVIAKPAVRPKKTKAKKATNKPKKTAKKRRR
ncbi:MAG: M23 family metallopeptidase [Runella slithyformis]|nr:MAG: M23 family metallopeptidase [Runella slithyformis]TAF45720.1 MAG: M23 family metallopeptidase [Runella slithyformis]TAF81125.1 MAG: M23 family metallopeptidase [Runella slithyformis]